MQIVRNLKSFLCFVFVWRTNMYKEYYYAVMYDKQVLINDGLHYGITPELLDRYAYTNLPDAIKALNKEKKELSNLTIEEFEVSITTTTVS